MATRTSELTIKDVYKPVRIKWKDRQTIRFFGKQSFHNNNSNNNNNDNNTKRVEMLARHENSVKQLDVLGGSHLTEESHPIPVG